MMKITTHIYIIYIYIYILKKYVITIMELKNQPIYKGVHKTLRINFRACAAFCPEIMYISLLDRNDREL